MHRCPCVPLTVLLLSVLRGRGRGRGRGRKRFGGGRRPGRPPKFIRLEPQLDSSGDKTTVWTHSLLSRNVANDGFSVVLFHPLIYLFKIEELLELAEKPLEEQTQADQNGLKVVEMEPEVAAVAEGTDSQLLAPAADQEPESVTLTLSADLPAPVKEDPTQSGQSDPPLSTQDMRRAKRIRVRAKPLLASSSNCLMYFFGSEILMF